MYNQASMAKAQINKSVLIIDDENSILEALAFMLNDAGYSVETSTNGERLHNLRSEMPDLILLDMFLSGENGRDLVKMLKSRKVTKHIPIIMISAHPSVATTVREYGADDFLAKPFDIDELLAKIKHHITKI